MSQKSTGKEERNFASEEARVAIRAKEQVRSILENLPPEAGPRRFQTIKLGDQRRGIHAILTAGKVVGSGRKGVYRVPERTITILDKLGIAYEVVE